MIYGTVKVTALTTAKLISPKHLIIKISINPYKYYL